MTKKTFLFFLQQKYAFLLNLQFFSELFSLFYLLSYQYDTKTRTKYPLPVTKVKES